MTTCNTYKANLEGIRIETDYASLMIMLPLDVAVAQVIEGGIRECNAWGDFLEEGYSVTNERIPTEEEIKRILDGK